MGVTAVLALPLLLLGISGLLFIYQEVSRLWSKSAVQNKVVVITDAISGLGKGKRLSPPLGPTPAPRDRQPKGGVWASLRGRWGSRPCSLRASVINQQVTHGANLLLWRLQLPRLRNEGTEISANSQPKWLQVWLVLLSKSLQKF